MLELDRHQWIAISLDSWTAGETQAIVSGTTSAGNGVFRILDLTTGETSTYRPPSSWANIVFTLPGSVRVWGDEGEVVTFIEREGELVPVTEGWIPTFGEPRSPSPNGEWIAVMDFLGDDAGKPSPLGVARLSTGEVTPFPDLDGLGSCESRGWTDSGNLLVGCRTYYLDPPVYVEATPSTGTIAESDYVEPTGDPIALHHGFWMSPGVWAGNGPIETREGSPPPGVGVEDNGVVRRLAVVDEHGSPLEDARLVTVVDGVLFVESWRGIVVAYDLATERQVVLIPSPPPAPELGLDTIPGAIVSWAVAP